MAKHAKKLEQITAEYERTIKDLRRHAVDLRVQNENLLETNRDLTQKLAVEDSCHTLTKNRLADQNQKIQNALRALQQ